MILADTSVWIDLFKGLRTESAERLRVFIREDPTLVVGDLIVCEFLQGLRSEAEAALMERSLRRFTMVSLVDPELAIKAAANYRHLRAKGITIRKTIDVIIGTFCIERDCVLLHSDRDFEPMEKHLGLRTL
jgi:predicted nucleic acid-binding protein